MSKPLNEALARSKDIAAAPENYHSGEEVFSLSRFASDASAATSGGRTKSIFKVLTITDPAIVGAMTVFDAAMIAGGSTLAWYVYHNVSGIPLPEWQIYVMASLLLAAIFLLRSLDGSTYTNLLNGNAQQAVFKTGANFTQAFMLFITFLVMTRWDLTYSRGSLVLQFLFCWISIMMARSFELRLLQNPTIRNYVVASKVVLIGSAQDIEKVQERWRTEGANVLVVGSFPLTINQWSQNEMRAKLGSFIGRIVQAGRALRPDRVVILLPCHHGEEINLLVNGLAVLPCSILVSTSTLSEFQSRPGAVAIGGMNMLRLVRKPLTTRDRILKRALDFSVSGILLLFLSPVLIFVALAIRIDSRGPVLFVQKRRGFNRRQFSILKFRTMQVSTTHEGFRQTERGDSRITRIGNFLRRWNVDELPQLMNVLRGEMSLVGPRPHAIEHDAMYDNDIATYARRHNIKPGITGLAQIHGCRGATHTVAQMEDRVRFDLEYIQNWSFLLDIKILLMTIFSPKAFANAF